MTGGGDAALEIRVFHGMYAQEVAGMVMVNANDVDDPEHHVPEFAKAAWAKHFARGLPTSEALPATRTRRLRRWAWCGCSVADTRAVAGFSTDFAERVRPALARLSTRGRLVLLQGRADPAAIASAVRSVVAESRALRSAKRF